MDYVNFYRCELCGNIVALVKAGGGTLTCCGQAMTKLIANSTDAAQEKHVPVAVIEGNTLKVTVGSVMHPMTPEHHIEWIALATADKLELIHLEPGAEPKAEFAAPAGSAVVYAYCNLHGLWKAEL